MRMSLKLALLFAASALSACESTPSPAPNPGGPVIVDDECPRADGQPCR